MTRTAARKDRTALGIRGLNLLIGGPGQRKADGNCTYQPNITWAAVLTGLASGQLWSGYPLYSTLRTLYTSFYIRLYINKVHLWPG